MLIFVCFEYNMAIILNLTYWSGDAFQILVIFVKLKGTLNHALFGWKGSLCNTALWLTLLLKYDTQNTVLAMFYPKLQGYRNWLRNCKNINGR